MASSSEATEAVPLPSGGAGAPEAAAEAADGIPRATTRPAGASGTDTARAPAGDAFSDGEKEREAAAQVQRIVDIARAGARASASDPNDLPDVLHPHTQLVTEAAAAWTARVRRGWPQAGAAAGPMDDLSIAERLMVSLHPLACVIVAVNGRIILGLSGIPYTFKKGQRPSLPNSESMLSRVLYVDAADDVGRSGAVEPVNEHTWEAFRDTARAHCLGASTLYPAGMTFADHLERGVRAVLDAPSMVASGDFECLAFPDVFPYGTGAFATPRRVPISFPEYLNHMVLLSRVPIKDGHYVSWGLLVAQGVLLFARRNPADRRVLRYLHQTCAVCLSPSTSHCTCEWAHYCGKEHQKVDWKRAHKAEHRAEKAAREAAEAQAARRAAPVNLNASPVPQKSGAGAGAGARVGAGSGAGAGAPPAATAAAATTAAAPAAAASGSTAASGGSAQPGSGKVSKRRKKGKRKGKR